MIFACGSNDGTTFSKTHFGDMNAFWLYDVRDDEIVFIKSIRNSVLSTDETTHNHKQKAIDILSLLSTEQVDGLINLAFGPNIRVIANYVIPIVTKSESIIETLQWIQKNNKLIQKTKQKTYYKINSEKEVTPYEIN